MKLSSRVLAFGLFFSLALGRGEAQVQASLVSAQASVQPGQPVQLALRLVHAPHWHTYWLNPGTGIATSLAWTLPAGWKAGGIEWPAPKILRTEGEITGNGYEGDILLPIRLEAPADAPVGSRIRLAAKASWLMCQDVCKPGDAQVAVELPVQSGPPAPDTTWGPRIAAALKNLPRSVPGWSVRVDREGKNLILDLDPAANEAAAHVPTDLHFFADDNLVAYELPQTVAADGHGGFRLTLPISPDGPADAKELKGVLTSGDGWRSDNSLPGMRIDTKVERVAPDAPGTPHARSQPQGQPNASGATRSTSAATTSLIGTLILAFLGGLILNLMPCVFPVLGIKILGFVNQAGSDRGKVAMHGLVFAGGVLLSFWTLAGVLALLRHGGSQLGWGFQLQSPSFVFLLAALMLVFALNLSGVFEFGLGATAVGSDLQSRSGLGGSFFTGVLATVVATPCSAPFLAPALGAALTLSFAASFAVFTAIAVGLSTPYLLLSIFPGAIRLLPRPGAWMETFRQLMAFPLYAAAGYLVWVLAGQVQDTALLSIVFGLVVVSMAAWIYGRWRPPGASRGRARFGLIGGAALFALGLWSGWPHPPAPTDVVWEKWSPQEVQQLRDQGRIVYVDFTARWCATCQANKRLVFHSPEVLALFRQKGIATLRGDWTNRDPAITAELSRYERSAVPFNLIWFPGRPSPVILPEILTPGIVLQAVKG